MRLLIKNKNYVGVTKGEKGDCHSAPPLNLTTKVGISHSHLYYIESKRVIPSIDVFVKISKALGINIKELID